MISTIHGTSLIQASTVLSITLQDYHESRQHRKGETFSYLDTNRNLNEINQNVILMEIESFFDY